MNEETEPARTAREFRELAADIKDEIKALRVSTQRREAMVNRLEAHAVELEREA